MSGIQEFHLDKKNSMIYSKIAPKESFVPDYLRFSMLSIDDPRDERSLDESREGKKDDQEEKREGDELTHCHRTHFTFLITIVLKPSALVPHIFAKSTVVKENGYSCCELYLKT